MKTRDYTQLLAELAEAYAQRSPASAALNERAKRYLVDGGSHALRLIQPFPPRIVSAQGAWVRDEDGHDILDFWQGHHANVLGHNPEVVTSALARAFRDGFGLQTGFTDRLQVEVAELLCQRTGAERVRFTTSGALATMYAILLARAFTGRELVMKVGGGWHGAQPWGLKGVGFRANRGNGFQHVDTVGLPPAMTDEVVVTRFNDPDMLRRHFQQYGDRVACFIVEPFIGAGGFMAADREYIQAARQLSHQYGALLILDEVISGFRFRAGDAGALYGVRPDLATFGKAIGGGMPVSAVAGRADVMALVGQEGGGKVKFSGGTYSAHPASLLAARTLVGYLVAHEEAIYPRLAELGAQTRRTAEAAFAGEGICARCTGYGNDALPSSSINMLLFPYDEDCQLTRPEDTRNPAVCDITLSEKVLQLALLLENVHVVHGLGSVTAAHTGADIEFLGAACQRVARRLKPYL
jgi:glutamate-1-semialdehyde 2,1-aminomutase